MIDWLYLIYIHPFIKQYEEDYDHEKLAQKCRDYLQEFKDKAVRRPFIHPQDWENWMYELDKIIEYFDIHSTMGDVEEIEGNLNYLGQWGNTIVERGTDNKMTKKLAWILGQWDLAGPDITGILSKLNKLEIVNGYRSEILEKELVGEMTEIEVEFDATEEEKEQ